jgi:DNA-binding IclR family transcriptional regulator
LEDRAAALQLTVRMGVLENGKIAYVEEKPDLMPGNSFPNRARLPVHGTALGEGVAGVRARVESRRDGGGPSCQADAETVLPEQSRRG